jgi:hypothetical protein
MAEKPVLQLSQPFASAWMPADLRAETLLEKKSGHWAFDLTRPAAERLPNLLLPAFFIFLLRFGREQIIN